MRPAVYAIPLLAALALFAPTLGYEWTFDDEHQITLPGAEESRSLGGIWSRPYWGTAEEGGLYRPVLGTTFWVEGRLEAPLPLRHGVNVALHGLVVLLLVRLALSLGAGLWGAGLAGLLFALHPVHVEAVAGFVGRAELLAAAVMLLALWLHDRGGFAGGGAGSPGGGHEPAGAERPAALLWGGALAFLAAGSKESAWALPAFAALLTLVRGRSLLAAWPAWGGYAAGLLGHLLLRHRALGGWLNAPGSVITAFDNPLAEFQGLPRLLGGLRVAGLDLAHLLFPVTLAPDYSGPQIDPGGGGSDVRLLAGVALLTGTTAAMIWARRRPRRPGARCLWVGGGWLLVSALLFMNVTVTLGTVLADRLLYWPSLAWVLVLAGLAAPFLKPRGALSGTGASRSRAPSAAGMALLLAGLVLGAAYAVRASRYLPQWRNDDTLFTAAVRSVPRVPRLWYNLGRVRQDQSRPEEALACYRRARELAPDYQQAWAQEATALMQLDRWEDAASPLTEALRLNPGDVVSRLNEGLVWLEAGDAETAARRFTEVLEREPGRTEALFNLALAENRRGRYPAAEAAWRAYLDRRPADPEAQNNLAWILAAELGRAQEAEALARAALRARPETAAYHHTLAEILFRLGRREEAVREAQEAVRLEDTAYYRGQLERFRGGG